MLHRESQGTNHSPDPSGLCAAKFGVGGAKLAWTTVEASWVRYEVDRSFSRRSVQRHRRWPDSPCHEVFMEHLSRLGVDSQADYLSSRAVSGSFWIAGRSPAISFSPVAKVHENDSTKTPERRA